MVNQSITISNSQVQNQSSNPKTNSKNKAISVRSVTKHGVRQHIIIRELPKEIKDNAPNYQNEYQDGGKKAPSTLRPPSTGAGLQRRNQLVLSSKAEQGTSINQMRPPLPKPQISPSKQRKEVAPPKQSALEEKDLNNKAAIEFKAKKPLYSGDDIDAAISKIASRIVSDENTASTS